MPSEYGGIACPKGNHAKQQKQTTRDKEKLWQQLRRFVLQRDDRHCRHCHTPNSVDVHHIKFRSAGGDDSSANCCCLCRVCHSELHAYRLAIKATTKKGANGRLTFTVTP